MNRIYLALLIVLVALAGCQKTSDEETTRQTPAEEPATESSAASSAAPPATPVEPEEPVSVEYRIVRAKIYLSDESIEILVPDNIDVSSNRLIEYEEGEDGQYYFVSLLPQ